MTTTRVMRRAAALTAVAALLAAGCTEDSEPAAKPSAKPSTTSPTPTPTPTPTGPPPHLPLTGRVVAKGEVPKRPALVVKVDNTSSASPQRGLGSADLVVEELVEGGQTRLAVFLHSRLPRVIGPVRSQRTSDIGVVKPTHGILVASGAAGVVERAMRRANVHVRVEGSPGFSRDYGRPAPYNLMVRPWGVVSRAPKARAPRKDYLSWAEPDETFPTGRKVRRAQVRFSPAHTTGWRLTVRDRWVRTNGLAYGDQQFRARNLIVVRVRTRDAGYRDPAGSYVPETVTRGRGRAVLIHQGHAVKAVWHKRRSWSSFRFTTPNGEPLPVPPGRTWIELAPTDGGGVSLH
ncbi:MAG: DUF3048 domain-containing protein [Actinomycetes bacterium]